MGEELPVYEAQRLPLCMHSPPAPWRVTEIQRQRSLKFKQQQWIKQEMWIYHQCTNVSGTCSHRFADSKTMQSGDPNAP